MKINISQHAKDRVKERINKLNSHDLKSLTYKAFKFGKTPVHYLLDGNTAMFDYLSFKQAKHLNKTLRVLNDMIYVFTLEQPTTLVTVYPISDEFFRQFKKRRKY